MQACRITLKKEHDMKLKYIRLGAVVFLSMQSVTAQMISYLERYTSNGGSGLTASKVTVVVDKVDYVNGGITFTYPAGTFTSAPMVDISIQLKNIAYSTGTIITGVVTANSATSTTVRVNQDTGTIIQEVATNGVSVSIVAFGS